MTEVKMPDQNYDRKICWPKQSSILPYLKPSTSADKPHRQENILVTRNAQTFFLHKLKVISSSLYTILDSRRK